MARVSFRLRTGEPDGGSHLRYDEGVHGVLDDYTSALRSDGLLLSPATSPFEEGQSFFQATCSCYGEVDLEWEVAFLPRAEGASVGPTPEVTETVLVYSAEGEPQTLAQGDILLETGTYFTYKHRGVPEGRWAYYSMFVHYQGSLGDDYYERVATLSILVTKDYGSTLQLWRRIPEFYRLQDSRMGSTEYPECIGQVDLTGRVGPLFRYLSIVGFDMDRMRTTIDYTMGARDPDVAHGEILDALADQMGFFMRTSDLGTGRLRRALSDIGVQRRSKGTPSALEYLVQAITGGDCVVDEATGDITIYSQRVNYITDPKDGTGIVSHRPAGDTEIEAPVEFASTAFNAASSTYLVSGTEYSPNAGGASAGVNCVMIRVGSVIPVRPGDRACFSVHSGIGTSAMKWARLVKVSDSTVVGWTSRPTLADGATAFEIGAYYNPHIVYLLGEDGTPLLGEDGQPLLEEAFDPPPAPVDPTEWTDTYIEFLIDLREASSFVLEYMLAERNRLSFYFDGSTVRGGWLIDSSSVSDYRWEGAAWSSVSLYADDYVRTNGVLQAMLLDEAVPINQTAGFDIVSYDAVPGF